MRSIFEVSLKNPNFETRELNDWRRLNEKHVCWDVTLQRLYIDLTVNKQVDVAVMCTWNSKQQIREKSPNARGLKTKPNQSACVSLNSQVLASGARRKETLKNKIPSKKDE